MEKPLYLIGLDRDGTINVDVEYLGRDPNWKDQIVLMEHVAEGIKILREELKAKIIVASNQAGVARGFFPLERVTEVNAQIAGLLRNEGAEVDRWYFSPHVSREYARKHNILPNNEWVVDNPHERKPNIGMLERALLDLGLTRNQVTEVYFIGGKPIDVETGINFNGKGILVTNGTMTGNKEKVQRMREQYRGRTYVANHFMAAVDWILHDTAREQRKIKRTLV